MANDYSLFIVDWPRFEKHFETSEIASIDESEWVKLEHQKRDEASISFLSCLYESDFSVPLSEITQFHSASESFHLWGALGGTYSEIRRYLAEEERTVYDTLYLPFIGPYMGDKESSDHPFELQDKFKQRLMVGGLYLALAPDSSQTMDQLFHHYSFSRLVHEVLALRSFPPPLPADHSFFHGMLEDVLPVGSPLHFEFSKAHLHAAFTEMTEGWRILTQQAKHRKWGIVAKYDV